MKLPNAEHAYVPLEKLLDYCLNTEHGRGKHKALLFSLLLDITNKNVEVLQAALLDAARTNDAIEGETDEYGKRFTIDFGITTRKGSATVRSCWIIRTREDFPRLISCYIV
jgi:hypothetical protein